MKNKSINLFCLVLFLAVTLVSTNTFAQEQQVKVEKTHAQQVKDLEDHCWNFITNAMDRYSYYGSSLFKCSQQGSVESFFSNECENAMTNLPLSQMKKDLVVVRKLIARYNKLNVRIRYEIDLNFYEKDLVHLINKTEYIIKNKKFDPKSANYLYYHFVLDLGVRYL